MQKQIQNTLYPEAVKKRLFAIIDTHFKNIVHLLDKYPNKVLHFNQSLLQDWNGLLHQMIKLNDAKAVTLKANNAAKIITNLPELKSLPQPSPIFNSSPFLLNLQTNNCEIFELVSWNDTVSVSRKKINFTKGYIRKYCSYNFLDSESAILIGGSRENNPNIKSKEIFKINIKNEQITKVGELTYGISSHSTVKIGQNIYIIGGNKDMNIVTKNCIKFNYVTQILKKMANLNYPSASHTSISWKDNYIYKFGGIGSCFGNWDLSPYIQRYDLKGDIWQVINPQLKVNENLLDDYQFFANSLALPTNHSIIILGGFDLNFKGSNKILQISINQTSNQQDEIEHEHSVIHIASLPKFQQGGFFPQEPIYINQKIYALQVLHNKQLGLSNRIIEITDKILYV